MTIHFYLNNEEETPITSFYDIPSNPFKLNTIVNLDVEELYPVDYNQFKKDFKLKMIENNKKLEGLFKRKQIKLVKEQHWVKFNEIDSPTLTIEYHCEFLNTKN